MAFSDEQVQEIKKQLLQQVENFPKDKKSSALSQIESMNSEELEEFLVKNNLINQEGNQCIFCSIVQEKIPSTKIAENENAIAILELNPISKSHALLIPKTHIESPENLPEDINDLAKQVSDKIKEKFSPKEILVKSQNITGHEIMNIIPVYENETFESSRKKASPEELQEIKNELEDSNSPTITDENLGSGGKRETPDENAESEIGTPEINEKNTWLPIRIP